MYKILIKKSAQKELRQIPLPFNKRIAIAIDGLCSEPRPMGAEKLRDEDAYRIRVADYRVVYTVADAVEIVEIERIRHRKDVYKNL